MIGHIARQIRRGAGALPYVGAHVGWRFIPVGALAGFVTGYAVSSTLAYAGYGALLGALSVLAVCVLDAFERAEESDWRAKHWED